MRNDKNRRGGFKSKPKPIDILKPIDFDVIGTPDDPCFGKHFSLTADECRECGDSELCSVMKAQNIQLFIKETKSEYRDTQVLKPKLPLTSYVKRRYEHYTRKELLDLIKEKYPFEDEKKVKRLLRKYYE